MPPYIDKINEILASGKVTYDVAGMNSLCDQLRAEFADESEQETLLREVYTPELESWLCE